MRYDTEANIISWEIGRGEISHAIELGDFIVHVSPKGKPVLIEVLEASKFVGKFDKLGDIANIEEVSPIE